MKKILSSIFICFIFAFTPKLFSQENQDPKVILITLDGLRWQELYTGADKYLVTNKEYVHDTTRLKAEFWREKVAQRREALMPFLWTEAIKIGQFHGNRLLGSNVDLTNTHWFSYPGYNEILSGKADDVRINSNDKINNPNITVLETLNNTALNKNKVAAFASWDVFPFIINEERSGVMVNAGFETAEAEELSKREQFLNQLQSQVPSPWSSVRLDAFTHHYALEFMKRAHPNLIYIAYGETDDFAHDGNYEAYLKAARNTDNFIKELWAFANRDDHYKNNTIFIITTDHGRGTDPPDSWQHHGDKVKDAGQVWLICFGNALAPLGEVDKQEQLYSSQIAPTILRLFGVDTNLESSPIKILEN